MSHDYYGLTPAMIAALFHKPNDRQFIIAMENSIISFVNSNADSYELSPMNSYFRLLSHQIAEYHNLKHALARSHDNCVVIFKGHGFAQIENKPPLQTLAPPPIALAQELEQQEAYLENDFKNKHTKKYRILRRSLVDHTSKPTIVAAREENEGKESSLGSVNSDATLEERREEKERQYELRKQEIFETPKKIGSEDSLVKDPESNSPQPHQFETSRYRLSNVDSQSPPQLRYNRRRRVSNYNNNKSNNYNSDNDGTYYNSQKQKHIYDNNNTFPNNVASYPMMSPYMMYPPPSMTSGSSTPGQIPVIYPSPMPIFTPGTEGHLNSEQTYSPPYIGYPNPNQMPFQYSQSPNFPSVPMYYGMYMPNYPASGPQRGQYQYNHQNSSNSKSYSRSNSSLESSKSNDSFRRSKSPIIEQEKENKREKLSDTEVEEISSELKELSV